jgi:hypothetical protein
MYQLKGSLLNDVLVPALSKFDRFIKNSFFHHGGAKCRGKYSVYCPAVSTQVKSVMILSPGVNILHFQTVSFITDKEAKQSIIFVPGNPFQPYLIFAGKARSLP